MDLTQLANIGEFIGGVAVLVTLVCGLPSDRLAAVETGHGPGEKTVDFAPGQDW